MLCSKNSFSIKFPVKKNPPAENKHWKSFQISVRCLSRSLSLSLSLSVNLSLCLFWKFEEKALAMWILKQFTLNQMVPLISIRLKRHISWRWGSCRDKSVSKAQRVCFSPRLPLELSPGISVHPFSCHHHQVGLSLCWRRQQINVRKFLSSPLTETWSHPHGPSHSMWEPGW